MVAIFCYVGAEVAIGSLPDLLRRTARVMGLTADDAKVYLSLYWGGAMIGRFLGPSPGPPDAARWRTVVMVGLGLVLFWLLFVLNRLESGVALDQVNTLLLFIGLNIFVFHLAGPNAGRALGLFALVTMGLLVAAVSAVVPGRCGRSRPSGSSIRSCGATPSPWPSTGWARDTAQGSSLLVMMMRGRGLLPYSRACWPTLGHAGRPGRRPAAELPAPAGLLCLPGLVRPAGSRHNKTRGRMIIGIDIGGTTSKLGLVQDGRVIAHSRSRPRDMPTNMPSPTRLPRPAGTSSLPNLQPPTFNIQLR